MGDTKKASQSYAIEVKEVTKTFGNHFALRRIDMKVRQDESVVIFGPNGAGKTTLIKILATIMNPSSGTVLVNSKSLKENSVEIRQSIGVISHQTFLYGNLTANENLRFYCRMYDVPNMKERIHEVTEMVDMISRLNDRVSTLSRGMQQRLSIARALLHKPAIMLLDEPETGLDQQAFFILREAIQNEQAGKRTIILITHSLERGLELCDRLLILNQGKIVYEGSTKTMNLATLKEAYHHKTRVNA